jgi:RIO kinase 2
MQVRQTRDYLRSRTASYNWLHLSHLSALKEYAFMQALHTHGFPVPQAVDVNRHAVLMALVDGVPLASLRTLSSPAAAWTRALGLMVRLAQHGLVHCDFNEFNLMVDDDPAGSEALTLIDFPQMVSTNHLNATTYYARDVACLQRFFVRRFDFRPLDAGLDDGSGGLHAALGAADPAAGTTSAEDSATRLDASLRASGFGTKEREQLEAGLAAVRASQGPGEGDDGGRDAYRRRGSDDEDEDEDEEDEGGDSVSEEETGEEEDELPSGGDGSDNGASASDDGDGDHGDDGGIPDACEPSQSALAAALLQRQREMHAAVVDVEVDGAHSDDEDGTEGGAAHAATAPSVSVGLSARQTEVRDRLRAERRRAGGARAVAAGSVRRTNFSKDKSGSHKKGGNASASDAVWG